jgi:hypothetical protein
VLLSMSIEAFCWGAYTPKLRNGEVLNLSLI